MLSMGMILLKLNHFFGVFIDFHIPSNYPQPFHIETILQESFSGVENFSHF
jgi:hypothetical protein